MTYTTPKDRNRLRNAKDDARAILSPMLKGDLQRMDRELSLGNIDPDGTFAGLSDGEKRAVLALAYYAAVRLEVIG